jgi:hypothetical protein
MTDTTSKIPAWQAPAWAALEEAEQLEKERQAERARRDGERLTHRLRKILGDAGAADVLGGPDAVAVSGRIEHDGYAFLLLSAGDCIGISRLTPEFAPFGTHGIYREYGTVWDLNSLGQELKWLDDEYARIAKEIEEGKERPDRHKAWLPADTVSALDLLESLIESVKQGEALGVKEGAVLGFARLVANLADAAHADDL